MSSIPTGGTPSFPEEEVKKAYDAGDAREAASAETKAGAEKNPWEVLPDVLFGEIMGLMDDQDRQEFAGLGSRTQQVASNKNEATRDSLNRMISGVKKELNPEIYKKELDDADFLKPLSETDSPFTDPQAVITRLVRDFKRISPDDLSKIKASLVSGDDSKPLTELSERIFKLGDVYRKIDGLNPNSDEDRVTIVKELLDLQDYDKAYQLSAKSDASLLAIIEYMIKNGNGEELFKVISDAMDTKRRMGLGTNLPSTTTFIEELVKLDRVDLAMKVIEKVPEKYKKSYRGTILDTLIQRGKGEEAVKLTLAMHKNKEIDDSAVKTYAIKLFEQGNSLDSAFELGKVIADADFFRLCNFLYDNLITNGKSEDAVRVLEKAAERALQPPGWGLQTKLTALYDLDKRLESNGQLNSPTSQAVKKQIKNLEIKRSPLRGL